MTSTATQPSDPIPKKKEDKPTIPPPAPSYPVDTASRRLERLLGGATADSSTKDISESQILLYSNPAKVIRRWLGTSSGAASKATLSDLSNAATRLLDPNGSSAVGREVLIALSPPQDEIMEESEEKKEETASKDGYLVITPLEVEAWMLTLAIRILWREGKFKESFTLATKSLTILEANIENLTFSNKYAAGSKVASLFPLLARMYRYKLLAAESVSTENEELDMRKDLVYAHRLACLRRDVDTQATLMNLMLRDMLKNHKVEQAQKLLSNSTFPENASNNQLCRYLYYSGQTQALRLEYTSAFSNLSQSLRKSPTNTALPFRITVQRLLIVVQLLMGEIPERHVFFQTGMQKNLEPYLKITQAVRRGDLKVFHETVAEFAPTLRQDRTFTLISRLAHSVIKAGLRKLNLSYSRISLSDIAERLSLPSAQSAEYVVAKAVRDGVIDATIDHDQGFVKSHNLVDIYATTEPTEAFHRRIAYCLTTHNDAVRGMRYPPDAYKKELEKSRGLLGKADEEEDKTDEEKAAELEDEFEEDF